MIARPLSLETRTSDQHSLTTITASAMVSTTMTATATAAATTTASTPVSAAISAAIASAFASSTGGCGFNIGAIEVGLVAFVEFGSAFDHRSRRAVSDRRSHRFRRLGRRGTGSAHLRALLFQNRFAR